MGWSAAPPPYSASGPAGQQQLKARFGAARAPRAGKPLRDRELQPCFRAPVVPAGPPRRWDPAAGPGRSPPRPRPAGGAAGEAERGGPGPVPVPAGRCGAAGGRRAGAGGAGASPPETAPGGWKPAPAAPRGSSRTASSRYRTAGGQSSSAAPGGVAGSAAAPAAGGRGGPPAAAGARPWSRSPWVPAAVSLPASKPPSAVCGPCTSQGSVLPYAKTKSLRRPRWCRMGGRAFRYWCSVCCLCFGNPSIAR